MTSGQIFLMVMLTAVFGGIAWQEFQKRNIGGIVLFGSIPVAAWLASYLGNKPKEMKLAMS